ncbi:MAG: hypothetical protein KKH28_11760 [Elusimicrobia bacterium]|nr:hypothetical protein [Elusimicrobiota bacterium]
MTLPAPAQPSRLITEPEDGRAPFLDAIKSARTSITLTTYQISDGQIVYALKEAQQRGVKVRLQYNYYSFANYTADPNELGVISSEKQVLDSLQKVFDQDWAR